MQRAVLGMPHPVSTRAHCSLSLPTLTFCLVTAAPLAGEPGDLRGFLPFSDVAPQDIARDPSDGTFWVTNLLDNQVHHYSADLRRELETIPAPFGARSFLTGIAFNSRDRTLLLAQASGGALVEVELDGTVTGRTVPVQLEPVVNENSIPTVRGLAFDPNGDRGEGSIYLVEAVGTLIYEISLEGAVIRRFEHPDDPDGFPGRGRGARTSDIDLIFEGERLAGFYVTGSRGAEERILRLAPDGSYTGISIPLRETGGNVSGILRLPIDDPATGEEVDAFVCVVESNARFAILEAGEPSVREIFDYECVARDESVTLSWTRRQTYDRIDLLTDCETLATLPGNESTWTGTLPAGIHEITLRAVAGEETVSPAPCTVVVGPGQVLQATEFEADVPVDMAWDPVEELLLISDAFEHLILAFDPSLVPLGTVKLGTPFLEEDDAMTGLALGPEPGTLFVYNTTQHTVGLVDLAGELVRSFPARLPNLEEDPEEEEDLGLVIGMAFDSTGDGGAGSLWLVEAADDAIYELDLSGEVLRRMPHPYRDLVKKPAEAPFGIFSGGVSLVRGSSPTRLYLTGGALLDGGQTRVLELDVETGEVVRGTEIPTRGIAELATTSNLTVEHLIHDGRSRLFILPFTAEPRLLMEVEHRPAEPSPVTFLECRQRSLANDVFVEFTGNGPYDTVEIFRDCELLAEIPGERESFVDREVSPGVHEYAVRGRRGGATSSSERCRLRVGPGAILQRQFGWPASFLRQMARDPVDGSLYVAVNRPGDERTIFRYDAGLRFVASRPSTLMNPWEIASLAIRRTPEGERHIVSIGWVQPVPLGEAGNESFLLVTETLDGEPVDEVAIDPPRPTNGFVTFPAGLTWASDTDTFYYLERNSKSFVEISPEGETLRVFPHPSPPFQNFVFNTGVAFAPERGTLFILGAGRHDRRVTKIQEMTLDGALTGYEVSLNETPGNIRDLALSGREILLVGDRFGSRLLRIKGFPGVPAPFIRGDSNLDGILNLTDAVIPLRHIFLGDAPPVCPDGADADDSGRLSITDAVVLMTSLFLSGDPLPEPFPLPGQDPTPDGLACGP